MVFFSIPSAAPVDQAKRCLESWKDRGYRVAIFREKDDLLIDHVDLYVNGVYRGYAHSVNVLAKSIFDNFPGCQIIVTGGDDSYPDPHKRADEIAEEFIDHFRGTLGVMQGIGDDWCGSYIGKARSNEVSAQSPWLGRDWCLRAYYGKGPYWSGYYHFWGDTELQDVAIKSKVFWQRKDLADYHDNWKRNRKELGRPDYLIKAAQMNKKDKELYQTRKVLGFPGFGLLGEKVYV
jgi:hypothetical protein